MLRYTMNHEWINIQDETGTVGITERRLLETGDVVFIDLPELGAVYGMMEPVGIVETREGSEFLFRSPVSGRVVEVNPNLESDASTLNDSPEEEGWIFKIELRYPSEVRRLMTESDYAFYEKKERSLDLYSGEDEMDEFNESDYSLDD